MKVKSFLLMGLISISLNAGIPSSTATTLFSIPSGLIEPQDMEMIGTVLSLPLYQDSEDTNLYYYVPPFRILPYDQGAVGMLLHSVKSENIFQADSLMKKMQSEELVVPDHIINGPVAASKRENLDYVMDKLKNLEKSTSDKIEKIEDRIDELKIKLEKAINEKNDKIIEYIERLIREEYAYISQKMEILKKEREYANTIRAELNNYLTESIEKWRHEKMRTQLYPVVTYLASAGKSIDMALYPDIEALTVAINNAIDELKKSYGGSLNINIYSGFTKKQVRDITFLREKYWPHVRIILMEAEDLQFESLVEIENTNSGSRQNLMFKNMKGAGGYEGAIINFDLTIDGATSLGMALGPFIVPVGISANITEKMLPFEAEITCNFTEHHIKNGDAEVRDGKVILPTDISYISGTRDSELGNCQLKVISGDENSARVLALKEIEKEFDKINLKKTKLSRSESARYYGKKLKDLQDKNLDSKTLDPKTELYRVLNKYSPYIGEGGLIKALGQANEEFWHTSDININRFYKLSFTKKFSYQGSQIVRKSMPAHLCLSYNAKKKAYDRCTRSQDEIAENPLEAKKLAVGSSSCQNMEKIRDCFEKRMDDPELNPEEEEIERDDILEL